MTIEGAIGQSGAAVPALSSPPRRRQRSVRLQADVGSIQRPSDIRDSDDSGPPGLSGVSACGGHLRRHLGVPEPHHPVSHHGDTAEGIAKYGKITTYHVTKLAEFIGKLQATSDGDATLLDRSMIYFGSGMGNGNVHERLDPPVLVMGGANGRIKGNRHIRVENHEPTANLLLTFGELAQSDMESIGHSTGRLSL